MTTDDRVWRLQRHGELLGEIVIDGGDFPWLERRFTPTLAFDQVKPLFDRELALLEARDHPAWDGAYDEISGSMTLVAPDGPVAEFLLHIKGDRAWFRWSDEPFPDEG